MEFKVQNTVDVLLHTCCAPCLVKCQEVLKTDGFLPTIFWYNPNIHPWTEYHLRKNSLLNYSQNKELKLIINEEYGLKRFIKEIYPNFDKKRCKYCYEIRLEETAKYASLNNYKFFSTTLLISPYQNHALIKDIGFKIEKRKEKKYDRYYRSHRHSFVPFRYRNCKDQRT